MPVSFDGWVSGRTVRTLATNSGSSALAFQNWRKFKEAFAPELIAKAVSESTIDVIRCRAQQTPSRQYQRLPSGLASVGSTSPEISSSAGSGASGCFMQPPLQVSHIYLQSIPTRRRYSPRHRLLK